MAAPRAKVFEYAVSVGPSGTLAIPDAGAGPRSAIELPPGWTADHLLLAALVRCSLESLAYHARLAGLQVGKRSGTASGRVTRRADDGRFAFVAIECDLAVELATGTGAPDIPDGLTGLAERDCFVGASLTVKPHYRWQLRGKSDTV